MILFTNQFFITKNKKLMFNLSNPDGCLFEPRNIHSSFSTMISFTGGSSPKIVFGCKRRVLKQIPA